MQRNVTNNLNNEQKDGNLKKKTFGFWLLTWVCIQQEFWVLEVMESILWNGVALIWYNRYIKQPPVDYINLSEPFYEVPKRNSSADFYLHQRFYLSRSRSIYQVHQREPLLLYESLATVRSHTARVLNRNNQSHQTNCPRPTPNSSTLSFFSDQQ